MRRMGLNPETIAVERKHKGGPASAGPFTGAAICNQSHAIKSEVTRHTVLDRACVRRVNRMVAQPAPGQYTVRSLRSLLRNQPFRKLSVLFLPKFLRNPLASCETLSL